MELKNYFAQDLSGNVLPGATAYLYEPGTTTLVTGLQDEDGDALTNPFTATGEGLVQFAAPNGVYDLRVTSAGRDYTVRIQCNDVADSVAEAAGHAADASGHAADAEAAAASLNSSAIVYKVANLAALRAVNKNAYSTVEVYDYASDFGGELYVLDAADTTSAESLPRIVIATDGGRWKLKPPMSPAQQDQQLVVQITHDRDRGQRRVLDARQVNVAADNGALQSELPLHIGTRRNVWQYTEDLASNRYGTINGTKQTDSIVVDGITLTRISTTNFYGALNSNVNGLGLTPFVAGENYLVSCFVLSRKEVEQFVMMRPLDTGSSQGHGQKLLVPNRMRRIWSRAKATSTSQLDLGPSATTALGSGPGVTPFWFMLGGAETGAAEVFIGGFQIEKLASNTYKDGIAMIGDSTMQGASGGADLHNSGAREVSAWVGALLNVPVFNRAVGGERTDTMDARWATDITPLAVNCKYVIIQGGINDIGQGRAIADIKTSITSMVTKAIADGLLPVLFTCTPFNSLTQTPAKEADRIELNRWMKATFPRVIDIAAVVTDPHDSASLRRAPGWFGDGTHYGASAKRAIGAYAAQWNGWDFITPSPYQAIPVATFTPPGSALNHNGLQVVGARRTGWAAPTGSATRTAFDTATVTTAQLAERVKALIDDLTAHGLIGS